MKLNIRVAPAEVLYQQGEVFTRMLACAQEPGHHGNLRGALGRELLGGICQRWGAQFEVSAKDRPTGLLRDDACRNGLHWQVPQGVTGTMCK